MQRRSSCIFLVHCHVDGASWNETYAKGQEVRVNDLNIYSVGNTSSSVAIIVIYDIRGFNISQTRVFCDRLAAEYSVLVVMPDFFRGIAAPTHGNISGWLISTDVGNWSKISADLITISSWLRSSYRINQTALIGFCWGGLQVVRACSNLSSMFFTGVSIHGSGLTVNEVKLLQRPILFIAAGNDPPLRPNISDAIAQANPRISSQCQYETYSNMIHGFVSAGANYSNPDNVAAIDSVHVTVRNYLNNIRSNNSTTNNTIMNNSVRSSMNFLLLFFICVVGHVYL